MSRIEVDATGSYLCALLETRFTPDQLAVATAALAPQLVIAGAGSGKTTVMAARVVHAVAFHRLPPGAVLGLTFTNKAAGELAERVRRALGRLPADLAGELDYDDVPTVATYHSYAAGIVRDHALRIGREPQTSLLTEAARWQLALDVVRRAPGPFRHLEWTVATVAQRVLSLDAELSEHLVDPSAVESFDREVATRVESCPQPTADLRRAAAAAGARDELLTLVAAYRAAKRARQFIDYGDQVALAAQIAGAAPEVGALERERFRLVLLDEYQDTGVAQRVLLVSLFGGGHPISAVGDPHQAIYGWRGASVGNLLRFAEHFPRADDTAVLAQPLMTSFRCGGRILRLAQQLVSELRASPSARRRPAVPVAQLAAPADRAAAGGVRVGLFATADDEANWIGERLAKAVFDDGTPAGDTAVLCRRRSDFPLLHAALVDRGLPVEVVGLGGLLEMPEVADVLSVLRLLVDPAANAAVVRLLAGPRWRIGPRDLVALGRRAEYLARPDGRPDRAGEQRETIADGDPAEVVCLLDAVDSPGSGDRYSAAAFERLAEFRAELTALRGLAGAPVLDVLAEVIRRTGIDQEVESLPAPVASGRLANLAAFSDAAARFVAVDGSSDLAAFVAFCDAASEAEDGLDVGGVSPSNSVKLMTVHKAKGLEWRVVAVPGLSEGVFPSANSRPVWTRSAYVLPTPLRGDASDLPALPDWSNRGLTRLKEECRQDDLDEESRLGYVAFTRARETLLLSGYWWSAGRKRRLGPSPLLCMVHGLATSESLAVDSWVTEEQAGPAPLAHSAAAVVPWPTSSSDAVRLARSAAAAMVRRAAGPDAAPIRLGDAELVAYQGWRDEAAVLLDELRRDTAAVRRVVLPARLTTSQLVALAADADGLARSLARPMPARPAPQARRGTRFHAWVESLYGERPLLDAEELPGAADAELPDDELAELRTRFLASEYASRQPVAVEVPFELEVGGWLLRGRIDAVYPAPDGFDVIDYKTGKSPRDLAAASLQLSVYRVAWAEIAGVELARVGAAFLYVGSGQLRRPERLLERDELAALLAGAPVL